MATTSEIMNSLPERFRSKMAGNLSVTIQYRLIGEDGGEWFMTIDALKGMIEQTKNFADYFSYFVLTEIKTGDRNWCLIFAGGQVDEMRVEFLKEEFKKKKTIMYFQGH